MKTFYSAVFMFILAAFAAAPAHSDVLYATSSTVNPSLLVVNPFDGVVHSSIPITNAQALLGGLCFDGVGFTTTDGFNNALQDRTFRINATTGAGTVVGNTGYSAALRSCDWHLVNDTIYQLADNRLYRQDNVSGAATLLANLGSAPGLDRLTAMAITLSGEAYVVDLQGTDLYKLNLITFSLTHIGAANLGAGRWFTDLAFDSFDRLWGLEHGGGLHTIDIHTGAATFVAPTGDWAGIAFSGLCGAQSYCTAKLNSLGCAATMISAGGPSAAHPTLPFQVSCLNVLSQTTGMLLYGVDGRAATPFQGGTLCIAPPIRRTPERFSGNFGPPGPNCNGAFSIDMNQFAAGNLGGSPAPALQIAGTVVDCQWWGRDPGLPAPNNSFLSNALDYWVCP